MRAQFFLRESDLGQPRATVTQPRLAELNNYVPVEVYTGSLTPDFLGSFGIVCIAGGVPMPEAIRIDEACRAAGSRFILSETFGVFGYTFCDFGDGFVCVDTNGEEPTSAMVASIDNSNADMGGDACDLLGRGAAWAGGWCVCAAGSSSRSTHTIHSPSTHLLTRTHSSLPPTPAHRRLRRLL